MRSSVYPDIPRTGGLENTASGQLIHVQGAENPTYFALELLRSVIPEITFLLELINLCHSECKC